MQGLPQTQSKNIDIETMRKNTVVIEPSKKTNIKIKVFTIIKKGYI